MYGMLAGIRIQVQNRSNIMKSNSRIMKCVITCYVFMLASVETREEK